MKRADIPTTIRTFWLVPLALATLILPGFGHAQSARFTLIDARNGLTPEVKQAYADAVGANATAPMVKNRVKIIANPRHGANFDPIDLPAHVRHVDLDISLFLQGSMPASKPINLNHLRLARRAPNRVSQKTTIQGR
ncbi:MAG: hypothetical protein AAGL97_07070 [Pseudomonadota bacterium]